MNVVSNISSFYGTHPWHWYLTQGLPVVTLSYLPFIFWIMWNAISKPQHNERQNILDLQLFQVASWIIGNLSLLSHKEFRFILMIVPITCVYVGFGLDVLEKQKLLDDYQVKKKDNVDPGTKIKKVRFDLPKSNFNQKKSWFYCILFALGITNFIPAAYFSIVHQRGVVDVMYWLRQRSSGIGLEDNPVRSVLFLMPCHSTPYYSQLHKIIPMRFLSCEPPIGF
ncbi:hypothetical protein HK096_000787, partial [Nowakowskiella sp. JEL0078]